MANVNLRSTLYKKLCKFLEDVNKHPGTPLTIHSAITIQERSNVVMTQVEDVHHKIVGLCTDDAALSVQEAAFEPVEKVYQLLHTKLREIITTLQPAASSSSAAASTSSTMNIKLPAIELPTFDGNFANWPSFKDLFLATVGNNSQLAASQKLQYLKSALQNEPATLIKPIPITDPNYKDAWDILTERYDNHREIVHSLINKLLNPKPVQIESAQELQQLIDNANECTRALTVLHLPVDQWDSILVVVHVNKLDSATRREWAIRQTGTTLPTFKEFTTFITNHIRGLQATGTSHERKVSKGIKSHHTSAEQYCRICKGSHAHYKCPDFISKPPFERSKLVKKLRLCPNCLNKGHRANECSSRFTCRKCGEKHHTLVHLEKAPVPAHPAAQDCNNQPSPPAEGVKTSHASTHHTRVDTQVLLNTAVVRVKDQLCRIFLDSGSEATFISEDCVTRLGLRRQKCRIPVTGISATEAGYTNGKLFISLVNNTDDRFSIPVEAYILPCVTEQLPKLKCKAENWEHLQGLQLADPHYNEPSAIDILVGADYVAHIMRGGRRTGPQNTPVAQETILGWVLSGRVAVDNPQQITTFHISLSAHTISIEDVVRRFWEVEEPPRAKLLTADEKQCEQHFVDNYRRDPSGRFIVAAPFNSKKNQLGESRSLAIRRLLQVERRLNRQPQHKQQYIDFMSEYEALGHMIKIPPGEIQNEKVYYLPHHFVTNDSSLTTKLRVVFDGSAKTTSGTSLNDALLVGPTLQDDLYVLLLRFRIHPIVLKADITKMFRQFTLRPEDAEYHRIIWRKSPEEPIADYRLLTVTYGTACAPYLSTRCLQQLAVDSMKIYPAAGAALHNDTYVDDLMTGDKTTEKVIHLYHELTSAVATAGLQLRKWSSNDPQVLEAIPPADRETDPLSFDTDQTVKALGVQWNPSSDTFSFKYIQVNEDGVLTKRVLLSDLSRVFDPIGFISPVTIRAKLMLQELWKLSSGWDDPVPSHIQDMWMEYQSDLKNIPSIQIPRRITSSNATRYELHGFCDASEKAYGAVIYVRAILPDDSVQVYFVTSKTRVAPLKQVTLPRLELNGAVLLSELIVNVMSAIKLDCTIFCWCDSTITLKWIASQPRRWKTYVANRVASIQELTPVESWRHVPGSDNPADLASRGVSVQELSANQFWWNGPQWLSQPQLPLFQRGNQPMSDLEERKLPILLHHTHMDSSLLQRFSTLIRLKRVTAYMLRFYSNSKVKENIRNTGPLSVVELYDALLRWCKLVQQQSFRNEINCLKNGQQIPVNSKLKSLHPYLDRNDVLRVSGRLGNADLAENRKHQIILPSDSHLTYLLIHHYHEIHFHSGFQLTWASIQAEYWVLRGRDKVRHYIRSCVTCRKQRAQVAEQLMGDLPKSRTTPSRPFLHTGVDYAGPYMLKPAIGRSPKSYKGYMCLFVCMATKAIHLEPVISLSTDKFLAALDRFVSRRGLCAHIYSDCGTNFIGADRELKKFIMKRELNNKVADTLSPRGVTWHFNPPSAPHHGGLWEAGVKSVKYHLRRVMGTSLITYDDFHTILCKVEAILNSRPLYELSGDPTDLIPLTPGHFLIGEPLTAVPDVDLTDVKVNRLSQLQLTQQRVQHFWRRWSLEYLNKLQQRNKWFWEKGNMKLGDLVVIKDETSPTNWKLGRITQLHPGNDGRVRVITVKTATSELQRPIVKIIPLLKDDI